MSLLEILPHFSEDGKNGMIASRRFWNLDHMVQAGGKSVTL
jgi:hypothetical protein